MWMPTEPSMPPPPAAGPAARRAPEPAPAETVRSGTQAIERALLLLRVVASAGRRGMPIVEISAASALSQSTVSRMLGTLLAEGMVERDARTRKYFVGHVVHELALVARPRYSLAGVGRPSMIVLAEASQDTIYLSEPSGTESVCTAREEGAHPIKALPLHVGIRRPMGVGAGGLAILAAMPPAQSREIVRANAARYPAYGGIDPQWLLREIDATRERGWSISADRATQGMTAIGMAIESKAHAAIGAFSIAAISPRMTGRRQQSLARQLREQCARTAAQVDLVLAQG